MGVMKSLGKKMPPASHDVDFLNFSGQVLGSQLSSNQPWLQRHCINEQQSQSQVDVQQATTRHSPDLLVYAQHSSLGPGGIPPERNIDSTGLCPPLSPFQDAVLLGRRGDDIISRNMAGS